MTAKRKNPRFSDVGLRKLLGWAQDHATTIGNVLLFVVLLLAMLWQGVAR